MDRPAVAARRHGPDGFTAAASGRDAELADAVDTAAADGAAVAPAVLVERWRAGRADLARALAALPEGTKVPWFGPPMSAPSLATARLMETWAHGVDVTDALRAPLSVSGRLRAVAHLGVRTRDFAFAQHGQPAPRDPFRVELTAPDGDVWIFGPQDAAQKVTGPAVDFCLRVTRRRHRADLAVWASGPEGDRWIYIALSFAGPPGRYRLPPEEDGG